MFIENCKSNILKISLVGVLIMGTLAINANLSKDKVIDTKSTITEVTLVNDNYNKDILLQSKYGTIILPESCRSLIDSTVTTVFNKKTNVSTSGKVIGSYKGADIYSDTQWDENYNICKIETSDGKVLLDIDNNINCISGSIRIVSSN